MNQFYKKPLMLAMAASMGVITLPAWGAAGPTPLNGTDSSSSTSLTYGKIKESPWYMPLEAKEASATYYNRYYGSDGSNATTLVTDAGTLATYIFVKPAYPVSANKTLSVKVSLTNGAKFTTTAPILICAHSATTNPDGALQSKGVSAATWSGLNSANLVTATHASTPNKTAYYITPTNQSTGQNSYTYIFPNGFVVSEGGSGACILAYSANPLADGAAGALTVSASVATIKAGTIGSDVKLNAEVTYDDLYTKVTQTATYSMISFVTAYKADFLTKNPYSNINTAAEATIDVAKLSKQFIDISNSNQVEAMVGYVTVTAVSPGRTLVNASGFTLGATAVIDSASIIVTGTTMGTISKVSLVKPSDANCKVTPTLAGTPAVSTTTGAVGGTVAIQVTGGAGTTYGKFIISGTVAAGVLTPASEYSGFLVCLVADTVTPMSDGQVSITVNGVTPAGAVVELGATDTNNSIKVKRNGVALRVLNIPEPKDPYTVTVRLYNASSQEVDVSGSLYDMSGKLVSEMTLVKGLKANSVKNVKSSDIAALAGTATWTGRAWMLIQAPISPNLFKVQTLMRSPTGALTNLSSDALD